MSDADIEQVRAFNRTVTQRIGALHDQYLARGRPLGASRVLWEIEPEGTDIRVIRSRLELDSGYLSRLLRRLEREDLVEIVPSSSDRRVRLARLTDAGHAERDELDRQSDALAESLLAALDDRRRTRLVDAMATVDRLLTAGRVTVGVESPTSPDARRCIEAYFHELDTRFEAGFDPASSISADAHELVEPAGLLLLARLGDEAVGCGALKLHGESPAEIKRMWVSPRARGLGVGRRLLDELELAAHARGATEVRLETNRSLGEAIELYRSSGYLEVPAFNDEPYAHHWFEKRL